jgi:hypothetical protein
LHSGDTLGVISCSVHDVWGSGFREWRRHF